MRAATDTELGREVAVKRLLRPTPENERRFRAEARITAGLQHPNVVAVHDVGTDAEGVPFLVMKRVEGSPLGEWARRGAPSLPRRLAVFRQVCDAIAYAHARGVVHRDLKPDNVLVGAFGEVQVLDWGLAGAEGGGGRVAGTPAAMAPEQARGEATDARTDVYALGGVLYELLTGVPPYDGPADEVLARVRRGDLAPPRARGRVPAELERVVLRAMATAPGDRYPTVGALAEDLDAWLDGRPLPHAGSTTAERLAKWATRHRRELLVAGVGAGLAAAGFTGAAVRYALDVGAARDEARARAVAAERAERTAALGAAEARTALALLSAAGDPEAARRTLAEARATQERLGGDPRRAALAAAWVAERFPSAAVSCAVHPGTSVEAVAAAPGGREVVSVGGDGRVVAFDPVGCAVHGTWETGRGGFAAVDLATGRALVGAADGWTLVDLASGALVVGDDGPSAGVGFDGATAWRRTADGELRTVPDGTSLGRQPDGGYWVPAGPWRLVTSWPDLTAAGGVFARDGTPVDPVGAVLAAAHDDGLLLLAGQGEVERRQPGQGVVWRRAVDGSPNRLGFVGDRAWWVAVRGRAVGLLRTSDGVPVPGRTVGAEVRSVGGDPAGTVLVVGRTDGRVDVFPLPSEVPDRAPLEGAHALAIAPSGMAAAIGADQSPVVTLLDLPTGRTVTTWGDYPAGVRAVAFSPRGDRLAVADRAGAVEVFAVDAPATRVRIPVDARPLALLWDESGLWVGARDGTVARLDPAGGVLGAWRVLDGAIWDLSAHPDGVVVASHQGTDRALAIVDREGRVTARVAVGGSVFQHDVDAAGRVVAALETGEVAVWDPATGDLRSVPADDGPTVGVAAIGDDVVAAVGFSGRLRLLDLRSGSTLLDAEALAGVGSRAAVGPDGALVAVGGGVWTRFDPRAAPRLDAASAALADPLAPHAEALATHGWWARLADGDGGPAAAWRAGAGAPTPPPSAFTAP